VFGDDWRVAVGLAVTLALTWLLTHSSSFARGMDVELEHGSHDPQTDVMGDDPILTGKIALAHMKEFPRLLRASRANGRRGRARLGFEGNVTDRLR